jgi:hemolysin type calcium-binding protein
MRSVLAATALLTALLAPAARAATVTSLSVYSDTGDFIGVGVPRVAHPGGPAVSGGPDPYGDGGIAVGAVTGQEGVSVEIAPPPGERLRPHNWTRTDRYPFQTSGRPGLTVQADSRGCNVASGSVEVLDVGFDEQGHVKRLWALFDHHCEGLRSSAFGEVRWRAWVPAAAAHVTPAVLRWPVLDSWWPAAPASVVYHGSAAVSRVAVAGDDAAHFSVRTDGCTGNAPPCSVVVDFAPTAPGARRARLEIVDTSGLHHAVTLEGFLHGGTTRADIEVLAGDVAAPPEDRGLHAYGPADTLFSGIEHAPNPIVSLFLQDHDDWDDWWSLDLYAGGGQKLQTGASYPHAQGNADGPGPGVRVSGGPAWCNQTASAFNVHSITYLPDGRLRSFDTSFERRCYDDERAAARGTWRFRAGDDVPLPDWMVPGPRPQIDVPPDLPPGSTTQRSVPLPRGCRQAAAARVRLGTRRADRLRGTPRADLIRGLAGNDRIHARAGADCVLGGRGADLLVGGPGRDLLDCGPGRRDRAVSGRGDRVRNCEHRRRARPAISRGLPLP